MTVKAFKAEVSSSAAHENKTNSRKVKKNSVENKAFLLASHDLLKSYPEILVPLNLYSFPVLLPFGLILLGFGLRGR